MIDNIHSVALPHILTRSVTPGGEIKAFYNFKSWQKFPLTALFSDRESNFKEGINRDGLCRLLGIERSNLIIPRQEHGGEVILVDDNNLGNSFFCDALLTLKPRVALGVLTADCLSLFLYDPEHAAIGIIHAGWRSSSLKITKKCIEAMKENFSTRPESLRVAIGPGMRNCCFEVKEDLLNYFPGYINRKEGRLFFDPVAANLGQLSHLGVKEENIIDSGICSSCHNDNFFSYRREGNSAGRMISLIMLI